MSIKDTLNYLPKELRKFELNPKVAEMLDYIITNAAEDFKDVSAKYRDPDNAKEEVVESIINEYGFAYINTVIDTLTTLEFNILLQFMGLLHFLKGTREGLDLILSVLGFTFEVVEWWEKDPQGEPHTFDMTIDMDLSLVDDVLATLAQIRAFTEEYVYPKFELANLSFLIEFVAASPILAGFNTHVHDGQFTGAL